MDTLLFSLAALLAALDVLACVVTFIWLLVLGQWWAIGYGFAAIPAAVALILLAKPAGWMRLPAMSLIDRRRAYAAYLCHLASRLYEACVTSGWYCGALLIFTQSTTNFSFWPLLVWGYGLALAAWTYASRYVRRGDTGDIGGDLLMACIQIAYLIDAVLIIFALRPPLRLIEIFVAIVFAGALAASITGFRVQKRQAARGKVISPQTRPPASRRR